MESSWGRNRNRNTRSRNRKFHTGKRILIWTAISWDGPEQLFFIEDKENKDVYEEILDACLPNIPRPQSGELIFMQDNASSHTALARRGTSTKHLAKLATPEPGL